MEMLRAHAAGVGVVVVAGSSCAIVVVVEVAFCIWKKNDANPDRDSPFW
jgi:hypothetical protein